MQPQLIRKDGTTITLSEKQYQDILGVLGIGEGLDATERPLTEEEANALLDELQAIGATWEFSTDDLLEERRKERELEQERERRYGISE